NKTVAEKYPETYDNLTDTKFVYSGKYKLTDTVTVREQEIHMGKFVLSPTRTYAPVIMAMLQKYRSQINGMIHCTGGAQTKILNFLPEGLSVVKDNLFETPLLFKIIQEESGTDWKEMYQVFNMGHRMEIITDKNTAEEIIGLSNDFNIGAQIIGKIENGKNDLLIQSPYGKFIYTR
ncbi:MAG: phosphoribosylformylglycinamidine cyclo-ligase, partial [Bacteroidales bacterium]|nr:phosphoribosylformylglycinamidine cyclo-ligase [Bacteroidales bacterium]